LVEILKIILKIKNKKFYCLVGMKDKLNTMINWKPSKATQIYPTMTNTITNIFFFKKKEKEKKTPTKTYHGGEGKGSFYFFGGV